SGPKMALEDAIALAFAVRQHGSGLPRVFEVYESERRPRVQGIQRAAVPSLRWYEQFRHYWSFPAEQFAFHFLTRSNYDYGQLKERDPGFVAQVELAVPAPSSDLRSLVISPAEITELVEVGQADGSTDMSRAEMDQVREALAATAAERVAAGYDKLLVELGRGQLLHRFLSP